MSTEYSPRDYSLLLRDFASYKLAIKGCSPKTVDEYMLDLRTFFRFIIADRNSIDPSSEEFEKISLKCVDAEFLRSVSTSDIYEFLFFCERELKNAAAARARKLSAIKGFFKYYTATKMLLENDPSANVETPKKKKSLPRHMSLEEATLFLNTVRADRTIPDKMRIRNYCMMTLFLNCGMRLSELVGINLGDIDKYLRSLRVLGKGNKERIIYLNDACRNALAEYLPIRTDEKLGTADTTALFLSNRGLRINNRTVQWTVEKYLEESGLGNRGFSVHKLRHTAATLMYQKGGVDVRILQEILGHEQLNTTQIYTHVSNSDIEAAMSKNPLSNIGTDDDDNN